MTGFTARVDDAQANAIAGGRALDAWLQDWYYTAVVTTSDDWHEQVAKACIGTPVRTSVDALFA